MYIFGEESDEDEKGILAEREYLHGAAQQSQTVDKERLLCRGRPGTPEISSTREEGECRPQDNRALLE